MSTDNPSDIPSIFQAIQEHVNNIANYIGIILCCYNYFWCIIMFYVTVWISFVVIEISDKQKVCVWEILTFGYTVS